VSYSILDLKNDLTGVLHQTQLNQITNLDGVIDRAARKLLMDVDPQETKRVLEFTTPVFNSVFDYAIADDVKGNKLIDIRPQVRRLPRDTWSQAYNQAFDIAKQNIYSNANMFTMNFNTGIKTIRIDAPFLNPPVIVDQIEAIAENGTWSTGGTAGNLTVNNTNFVQGAGSLQFDITAGAGWIENSTLTAVNLSAVLNQASFFISTYFQTGSLTTSVNLRIGSSPLNYYSLSVAQNQNANSFVNGWNREQFQWKLMSVTGNPNSSAISYARITVNATGTQTGCLINGLDSILGSVLEYEYYSKFLFRNSVTGAFQENVDDDSNLINLDTESYNLLFNIVAYLATQQQQGLDATFYDGNFFLQMYTQDLARYKSMYKSELQKPQTIYYAQPNKSYRRFFGRFGNN
jgi:hypothetical protein